MLRGCRSAAVRRLAFYPPTPPGYSLEEDKLYIQDPQQQTPRESQSQSAASLSTSNRGVSVWGESVQEVLRKNNLPERVRVCIVPRQRRFPALRRFFRCSVANEKGLAAVLLWSPVREGASSEEELLGESLKKRQLVLFSHGNSTDIGYMFGVLYRLCYRRGSASSGAPALSVSASLSQRAQACASA